MIEVSGEVLEGGGQIVRTSIALSALTGKPVRINKIREKRPNPGLQAQHVVGVRAVGAISNAETQGLVQGSRELVFIPRSRASGHFSFVVGTAGSIPLILQALLPAAAYAPAPLDFEITGGTDVKWSPTIDYVRLTQLPILHLMGYKASIKVHQRGHYPKGGGQVSTTIDPPRILAAVRFLARGQLLGIEGISHCVKLPNHVAERQANAAKEKLRAEGFGNVTIATETYPPHQDQHLAPGSGITLVAKFENGLVIGADSIGERGKPAEAVGADAANKLVAELSSKAPVDRHMGDILIPYMAVASGRSQIHVSEITLHTLTNIKVAEMITGANFIVEGEMHHPATISAEGIGLKT
jgi:RNA 3'-terminal phosphate cyclase (ATP)